MRFAFLLLIASCRTVLVVDDGEDGSGSSASATSATGSTPTPCEPDPASLVSVTDVESATITGAVLQLAAVVDGEPTVALFDRTKSPMQLLALRPDLGGARWVHVRDELYARVRGDVLEVMDTVDPTTPSIVRTVELGGPLADAYADTWAAHDGVVEFCLHDVADEASYLTAVDLANLDTAVPVRVVDFPCEQVGERASTRADLWINWREDGYIGQYNLDAHIGIDSHSFATNGVHNYGFITAVETDGVVSAATVVNESYVFLYYAEGPSHVVYSSFGGGKKSLLAVVEGSAVVAFPGDDGARLLGFDLLSPPPQEQPAERTALDATLTSSGAFDEVRVLDRMAGAIMVTDGDHLYIVDTLQEGPSEPILFVRDDAVVCP